MTTRIATTKLVHHFGLCAALSGITLLATSVACTADPESDTEIAAANVAGEALAHVEIEVASGELLEIRSLTRPDQFAVTALIENGPPIGDAAYLVVETECRVLANRLQCDDLGSAPIVTDETVGEERVVTIDLQAMELSSVGDLTWLWALDDEDTSFGVQAGDDCYSGPASTVKSEPIEVCTPSKDGFGEVCCMQTCDLHCIGGSATVAGKYEASNCTSTDCKHKDSPAETAPAVTPSL